MENQAPLTRQIDPETADCAATCLAQEHRREGREKRERRPA